jgi:hypothetical protein
MCPTCKATEEDNSHFVHCPHILRLSLWRLFHQDIAALHRQTTTDPGLQLLLAHAIERFRPSSDPPQGLLSDLSNQHQELLAAQGRIGWKHILHGRLSQQWVSIQSDFYAQHGTPRKYLTAIHWARQLITVCWKHVL